jgi:precorrin-6B methylase 2
VARAAGLIGLALCAFALVAAAPDEETEFAALAHLLEISTGSRVADVGAGDGEWTLKLADLVGPEGRIWATEVESDLVADLERTVEEAGLENITVVLGTQTETGLTADCCDAILLRMVYHHFQEPDAMRRSLHAALAEDGLIVVVDIVPQEDWRKLEGTPDRGGHGIAPEVLVAEMASGGFRLVALQEDWNDDQERFCALFRRIPYQATP